MFAASELLAARWQMAVSLGFHIVLSCFGVAFPAMIYVVHRRGIRNGDMDALALAKKWGKVAAVLFAVGAVSGTILSFEMGLLWPRFMAAYGDVIGLPFALEGIAFFLEAVFIGIYLYGWGRLRPEVHLRTLIPIMASGLFGTFCILAVNAWMNSPAGFEVDASGNVTDVDPLAAMFNSALWPQFLHMFVAAYAVAGFLTAAVYAVGMLRGRTDRRHRIGFTVPFAFAAVAAVLQPFIGHVAGMRLATEQPAKLAAMELATETRTNAPLLIGGVLVDGEVRWGLEIPRVGSLLARGGFDREVVGLEDIPVENRPPANVVRFSFQAMVGAGFAMVGVSAWYMWRRRRTRDPFASGLFLKATVAAGGLAVVALEAGWITTEVGRQPWIAHEVMRVEDAVTGNSGIWISFAAVVVVYTSMGIIAVRVLRSMAREVARIRRPRPPDAVRSGWRTRGASVVSVADVAAVLMFVGVIAYALFGGADFGSGVWDLLAGDARRGAHLRAQIDRSIGPVWEANHVWLVYILVFLWTGFPEAFGAIMTTLFIPWLLVGGGIVLRGGAFAFRKFSATAREAQLHGIVFAASSLITPFFLGMIAGAIASGRVPSDGNGDVWTSWTGPTSWIGGVLAVLTCAFLAGTFLAADSARAGDDALASEMGRRALICGAVTGAVAIGAAVTLELDADSLASGLHGRGLPAIIVSAVAGGFSLWRLRERRWARARVGAVIAVAAIVAGWGIAQYPDLLVDEMTIEEAAGARSTLIGLMIVFGLAAVTAVPALLWLYTLVNREEWATTESR